MIAYAFIFAPSFVQDVPTSVASDQLDAALAAEIEAQALANAAAAGPSLPVIFLFAVLLGLSLSLAWVLFRTRGGRGASVAHAEASPARLGWDVAPDSPAGEEVVARRQSRPETEPLSLPPHLAEVLARKRAARRATTEESAGDEARQSDAPASSSGAFGGLDVVVGS